MEHLPPWLRNVPLPARPAAGAQAADDTPDWLREPAAPAAPPPAPAPAAPESDDDTPDWLRDLQSEIGATPTGDTNLPDAPDRQGADDAGTPEWLRDLDSDDAGAAPRSAPESFGATGWLSSLSDDTPAPDEPEPTTTTSRIKMPVGATDWLRSIGQETDPEESPSSPTPSEMIDDKSGVPDWLRDVSPSEIIEGMAEDQPPDDASSSAPAFDPLASNWLTDEPAADVPDDRTVSAGWADNSAAQDVSLDEDNIPDWLRDVAPETLDTPGGQDQQPRDPSSLPDWLSDSAEEEPSASVSGADVPDWLRDISGDDASAESGQAIESYEASADVADDVPSWLREAEQAPPAAPPAADVADDVPSWLHEAEQAEPEGSAPPASSGAAEDLPAWLSTEETGANTPPSQPQAGDMSLPSWLRGVADEPPPARPAARAPKGDELASQSRRRVSTSEDAEGDDFFKGADLPDWLRPPEPELPTGSPEGQALDWLTRLGASDEGESESALSSEPEVAKAIAPTRRIYQRSPEQLEAIALLGRLVRAPYPAPVAPPTPAPLSRWQRIGLDRVLYALLAIALLAGLIAPQITAPFQTTTPSAPGAAPLEQQLASLGPESVVMVAYEWDAQRSAELRPLERAVTNQLIAQRSKLILLSTDLQGTMLSFDMRGPLRAAGYNIDPDGRVFGGRDYVLLGYRPGGELALRQLAQDLRGELRSDFEGRDATPGLLATRLDGTPRITSIRDLAMIVVLADQPQDVQIWMEQVHTAAPNVPITFLMPQEAEPLVQPYLHLNNVYHLAGLQGALALNALTEGVDPSMIARATGQQSLAVLAFVILLVGGGLGVALTRARPSRRGSA